MRTIRELLKIMLDNQELFQTGLCGWCHKLYFKDIITKDEYYIIRNYIYKYPTKRYKTAANSSYYWEIGDIDSRIKWLKKHIKLREQK